MAANHTFITPELWADWFATAQRESGLDASEKFEEAHRKLSGKPQGAHRDDDTLMTLPDLAADGELDLQQSLTGLIRQVVRANLRASQELLRVTSHGEFLALQQRFISDYMNALMRGGIHLITAMSQISPPRQ